MAYDRLLQRLYVVDQGWIVKGATALLARDLGVRATIDIDLYRALAGDAAEREARRAAALEIGDWFHFEMGAAHAVRDAANGRRLPVTAYIGTAPWAAFHVDLVGPDLAMTGEPDDMPALARITMPGVRQRGYRVYPLVDHIADKVVATFDRYGDSAAPSTRYKDLVDLVAITTAASVEAAAQLTALAYEAARRRIILPLRFVVPDRDLWERGYAAEAGRSLLPAARTLEEALGAIEPFLDPLLARTAVGIWNPGPARWVTS